MRRDFLLQEQDAEYLDSLDYCWETILEGQEHWTVIRDWILPEGYQCKVADVALKIEPNYPDTQIDMAYFYPFLTLKSGADIPRTQVRANFENRQWQGWSRHRTSENPWRIGIDYIGTHMIQVKHWLQIAARGVK